MGWIERQCAEPHNPCAGADGRQQFTRVFRQKKDAGVRGWFFQYLQQRVSRFLHERGAGEDIDGALRFRRHAVNLADDRAHLSQLDEELWRIGRNYQYIGVRLNEDARLLFVDFAQVVARDIAAVPEPLNFALVLVGFAGLVAFKGRLRTRVRPR